jgi:hypothetical protein
VNTPASPTQWLYGLYEIILVTGFVATIAGFSLRFRRLDASTGASDPNDFAVRNSALVFRTIASTASPPHVRDDGQRPSARDGMAEL